MKRAARGRPPNVQTKVEAERVSMRLRLGINNALSSRRHPVQGMGVMHDCPKPSVRPPRNAKTVKRCVWFRTFRIYWKREPTEPRPLVTMPANVPLKAKPHNVRLAERQAPPGLRRGKSPINSALR